MAVGVEVPVSLGRGGGGGAAGGSSVGSAAAPVHPLVVMFSML